MLVASVAVNANPRASKVGLRCKNRRRVGLAIERQPPLIAPFLGTCTCSQRQLEPGAGQPVAVLRQTAATAEHAREQADEGAGDQQAEQAAMVAERAELAAAQAQ